MRRVIFSVVMVAIMFMQASAKAGPEAAEFWENHPSLQDATIHVYKNASGVDLKLYTFNPPGHAKTDRRAAIIFFFGGGWTTGTPTQFAPQSRHLASRGMVAICANYRIRSRNGVAPAECVSDAKSAIRWARSHAAELGIDPDRIAAGGGSAGGHIAACAGVVEGYDDPGEDPAVSSVPNALVLFNAALDVTEMHKDVGFGDKARELSPVFHIRAGAPPAILLHGTADRIVPYDQAVRFFEAMKAAGNRCELVGTDGEGHGFFNHAAGGEAPADHPYHATLQAADQFLVSLGYLPKS